MPFATPLTLHTQSLAGLAVTTATCAADSPIAAKIIRARLTCAMWAFMGYRLRAEGRHHGGVRSTTPRLSRNLATV